MRIHIDILVKQIAVVRHNYYESLASIGKALTFILLAKFSLFSNLNLIGYSRCRQTNLSNMYRF
jgi:hypothetical protein